MKNLAKQTRLVRQDDLLRETSYYFSDPGPSKPEESRDNDIGLLADIQRRFPPKKAMHVVWSLKKA